MGNNIQPVLAAQPAFRPKPLPDFHKTDISEMGDCFSGPKRKSFGLQS